MAIEILAAAAAQTAAAASGDAWARVRQLLQDRKMSEAGSGTPNDADTGAGADKASDRLGPTVAYPAPTDTPASVASPLADVLEEYYKKVGKRADVSFFIAVAAAVLGYLIIGAGITVGVMHSDDTALAVAATAAGAVSQALSFLFFRNRAEERKMMIEALAGLREDAEKSVRAARSQELIEQIQQPLLKDNLTAAVALELSGASTTLTSIHDAMALFHNTGSRPAAAPEQQWDVSAQESAQAPSA
ncbi:TRADD-N-associated membrane domain-containing protein [Streptomyces sp. NPDC001675]